MRRTPRAAVVYGYVRVSTDEQQESPATQRAAIRRAVAADGLDPESIAWREDIGLSGMIDPDRRPGLAAILAAAGRGDAVYVQRRDRLCRDSDAAGYVAHVLRRRGAEVRSCDGMNGDARAARWMRAISDLVAQDERDLIAERVRSALRTMREAGRVHSSDRYGWAKVSDMDGRVVDRLPPKAERLRTGETFVWRPVPEQQAVIKRMLRWRARGMNYREIADRLNRAGVPSRRRARWRSSGVESVIRRNGGGDAIP